MDLIQTALEMYDSGKVNEAVNYLLEHISSETEEDQFAIGELLHSWGYLDEALNIFKELLQDYPDDFEIKFMLADIYIDLEQDEKALDLVESIEPNDPNYIRALVVLADIYQSQGLYEVSEQKLLQAKQLSTDDEAIDLGLAELYFHVGDYAKAIPYYEKLADFANQFPFVNITERLAECYSSIGKWEEALNVYQQLELNNPDDLFKYGYTAYQLERYDISIKVWKDLIKLDRDYTSVYPYLAKAYEYEGMLEEANHILKNGLKNDEYNIDLYITLARNELKLNRIEEAKSYLKEAIALDPGHEEAIEELLNIYFTYEEYNDAKKLVEELMKFQPYPDILEWRAAQIYNELDLFEQSQSMYEKASLVFKSNPDFQKEYGFFLVEEGNLNEAIQYLRAYINEFPDDLEVMDYLERLEND
ncbi:tetratricopeptide repeat protein [Bacillaceae bacterium W0354]